MTLLVLRRFKDMKDLVAHSGAANAATLTFTLDSDLGADTAAAVVVEHALKGLYISNDTDGSFGPITDNDTTTITATLAGGTQNDWDVGDAFSLWHVVAAHTANAVSTPEEPEVGADLIVLASAWTSGTARVRISQ